MIQFHIISGKQAGSDIAVRRFPFMVGRAADADYQSDEAGVWDRHVKITFDRANGFFCQAQPNATVLLNGEKLERAALRNGDILQAGSLQLRFWLPRSPQKTMRAREFATWAALIGVFVVELALIYHLLR